MSAPTKSTIRPWIMQRQVAGELRLEDLRVEVPGRRAVDERAEEERGEGDADGRVPAEQRDGDAEEADRRDGWMSLVESRNCQPSMSIAPARPANAPEIAIARK